MKSEAPGRTIFDAEVTNVSRHGLWILVDAEELFLPFAEFPWFRDAAVGSLFNLQRPRPGHLRWPDLDVDLEVESIKHPERFPLISQG